MKSYMTIILNKELKPHEAFEGACMLVASYYQSLIDKQRQLDEYTFVKDEPSLTKEKDEELNRYYNDILAEEQWIRESKQIKFLFGTEIEIENLSSVYEDNIKIDKVGVLFPPMLIKEMPVFLQRYIKNRDNKNIKFYDAALGNIGTGNI